MNNSLVPFRLTVCGVSELAGHCDLGVSHVLSILDPGTPQPEAFGAYGEHRRLELRFHDIIEPRPDMVPPQPADVERLLAFGRDLLAEPEATRHLLVHCFMGVSRSTASMALILAQARPDRPASEIWETIRAIRPIAWPNLWMIEMGDALLGRRGELIETLRDVYRSRLKDDPQWREDIVGYGRARELAHM